MSTANFPYPRSGLIMLAGLLLLSACASKEFVPSSPAALHQAASATLAQSVYVQTLTDQCARLGGEVELQALQTYQDWLSLNWSTVVSADQYFTRELMPVTHNYQDKSLALEAVHLSHSAQRRALAQLDLQRRTNANQVITCTRELRRLAQQEMSVMTEAWQAPYLDYLKKQYPHHAEKSVVPVPTLAAQIPLDLTPGRSYYAQEEPIKQLCPSAEFIVLHNQWPNEAYGVYCENLPLAFIRCEWGHCQQVEL